MSWFKGFNMPELSLKHILFTWKQQVPGQSMLFIIAENNERSSNTLSIAAINKVLNFTLKQVH